MTDKDLRQAEYFRNRVAKNEHSLRKWIRRESIEALRLYDRDIPEIPLALDRYGLGSEAALVLYLYKRPYEKPEEEENAWLELMASTAAGLLDIDRSRVFVKTREKQKGLSQYGKMESKSIELVVRENGRSFIVNLADYLDTGLFLDHRQTRALVAGIAKGKRVLNLFAYTGAFSVYASSAGAEETWSVDLSNTYLAWAARNLALNGLSASSCPLVKSDVSVFLEEAGAAERTWDIIVADPPTYSNSRSTESDFDINRDWPSLISRCLSVLEPGGRLFFSSNSRRLRWDASLVAAKSEDISAQTIPPDFRQTRIHRTWCIAT
jgi:23S rRNA (cytosine1962-C5)-methyltransferase